jgi:signal peptidase I
MTTEDGARSAGAMPVPAAEPSAAHPRETEQVTRVAADEPDQDVRRTSDDAVDGPAKKAPVAPPANAGTRRLATNARSKPKKKSFLRELPGIIGTALIISVLIKTFLVQAFYIPSGSMENTLQVNDRVLVNKLADKPDEIHRGDVVVFRDPGGWLGGSDTESQVGLVGAIRKGLVFVGLAPAVGEEDLIKRVIGVGGDTVKCCDAKGRVTVNGVPLTEPYLYPSDLKTPSAEPFGPFTVPAGKLWVMGDHRSVSQDSREHVDQPGKGFVPVADVVGRAFTIVWPLNRAQLLHRPDTFRQPSLESSGR